jgi:hypothetical protein
MGKRQHHSTKPMIKARGKPISRAILDTTFEGGMFVRIGNVGVDCAVPRARRQGSSICGKCNAWFVENRSSPLWKSSVFFQRANQDLSPCTRLGIAGLPGCFRCANLRNCAVLCAERECVRGFPGVPGNVLMWSGWRSSAGRASDL